MKMEELIQKASEIYREEIGKAYGLQRALGYVEKQLEEIEQTHGENITLAEYDRLTEQKSKLTEELELKKAYCEGIYCVREMFMDLGFNTNIKL